MKYSFVYIFLFSLLFSCGKSKENAATEPAAKAEPEKEVLVEAVSLNEQQYKIAEIALGKIEKRALSGVLQVSGKLDVPPQNLVSISSMTPGFLRKTDLLEGMFVRKGQVLAVIENPELIQLQQDYLDLKSQYEYAESEYQRQQELAVDELNARKTLQQAKSQYFSLQAKVAGTKEKLKVANISLVELEAGHFQRNVNVIAPISGYVTRIQTNIGKYISPTDVLFHIVDTEHLHCELNVYEKDIPKLKVGQKIRFTLANESKERTATIHLIGKEIGDDKTVRVHGHLDQEDTHLIPNTFLTAQIETTSNDLWTLPDAAVLRFGNGHYIFAFSEKRDSAYHFEQIEVMKGLSQNGYTEISLPSDFDMNRQVAISNAYAILSKMKNQAEEE